MHTVTALEMTRNDRSDLNPGPRRGTEPGAFTDEFGTTDPTDVSHSLDPIMIMYPFCLTISTKKIFKSAYLNLFIPHGEAFSAIIQFNVTEFLPL